MTVTDADCPNCILLSVQFQCFFKLQTFNVCVLLALTWNSCVNLVCILIRIRCKTVYCCLLSSEVICKFILDFSFSIFKLLFNLIIPNCVISDTSYFLSSYILLRECVRERCVCLQPVYCRNKCKVFVHFFSRMHNKNEEYFF